ncbi:hypothetical protein AX774_g7878 [Zancudomyces culisetae]|uniref:Uncharacterized protein n=1 Tax=Zancudomyces culisetae TaxID=1213189 RepID=A0A1R1PCM0_ZANCU|nr:hypothetical protein AX774_g7878 [Zancudomyces culisetae]|eukprot:OMH78725.1 hypothetical protein AX774_g7878 [Zancudomyces culisetae]
MSVRLSILMSVPAIIQPTPKNDRKMFQVMWRAKHGWCILGERFFSSCVVPYYRHRHDSMLGIDIFVGYVASWGLCYYHGVGSRPSLIPRTISKFFNHFKILSESINSKRPIFFVEEKLRPFGVLL